jgi:hypothetical protein
MCPAAGSRVADAAGSPAGILPRAVAGRRARDRGNTDFRRHHHRCPQILPPCRTRRTRRSPASRRWRAASRADPHPGASRYHVKLKVDGPVHETWTLGYLTDTIYLRDLWIHPIDAARAARQPTSPGCQRGSAGLRPD